jgi:carbon-monoxide dehydrogenase large subunit
MGLVYDSCAFHGYQRRVLAAADWAGFAARREAARSRGKIAGIGYANYVESPVGAASERVDVSVSGQGVVEVIVGTQSTGQGHETTFAQVIADRLGVPFDCVRIRYGDTDFVKAGGGTHSDRSMRLAGTLLMRASDDIIGQGREAAAALLEAAACDLVFESGRFLVAGSDRAVGLFDVAGAIEAGATGARRALAATRDLRGRIPAFPAGAAVCALEVDAETVVGITRYTRR